MGDVLYEPKIELFETCKPATDFLAVLEVYLLLEKICRHPTQRFRSLYAVRKGTDGRHVDGSDSLGRS